MRKANPLDRDMIQKECDAFLKTEPGDPNESVVEAYRRFWNYKGGKEYYFFYPNTVYQRRREFLKRDDLSYYLNVYDPSEDITILRSSPIKTPAGLEDYLVNYTDMSRRERTEFYGRLYRDHIAEHKSRVRTGSSYDLIVMIDD